MAWLDLYARTAGIYDSLPSQEGEAGAARIVREVIHMLLPKSSSEGGQDAGKDGRSGSSSNSEGSGFWTVEHPAFARQPTDHRLQGLRPGCCVPSGGRFGPARPLRVP